MTTVPVENNPPIVTLTATPGQTVFDFGFLIQTAAQLQVIRTPAGGGTPVTLVLDVDFTVPVTSIGTNDGGVALLTAASFPTGATENDLFTLARRVPIQRLTTFPFRGVFNAATANFQFDSIFLILQELERDIGRAFTLNVADSLTSIELPLARADSFLAFDGQGQPIAAAGTSANLGPVSVFTDTLLPAVDAAAWRTSLEAVGTTGDDSITGAKTFTGRVDLDGPLALGDGSELTIAAGAVTPTANYHIIDTQGNAATDDLTTIVTTNVEDGAVLVLQPAADNRTVVVVHDATPSAGAIVTADGKDVALADIEDMIVLKRRGTFWEEVSRTGRRYPAGTTVQTQMATSVAELGTSAVIALDTSIPQNTEGDEFISLAFTPRFADSRLKITFNSSVGGNGAIGITAALFQDADSDAILSSYLSVPTTTNSNDAVSAVFVLDAANTATRTYRIRVGVSSGTAFLNRSSSVSQLYGNNRMQSSLIVEEIAQ